MFGQKIDIKGVSIHYEKLGNGSLPVLLLPGGVGSTRTDLTPQLEGMSLNKFTLVAWDPPGYGYSRPPERDYTVGVKMYQQDADMAAELMQKLGYSSYAVMGWSDGGRTGLVMAIAYPSRVDRLVIWGAAPVVTERQKKALETGRNINHWDIERRQMFEDLYGTLAQEMWSRHVNYYRGLDNICKDKVHTIRCPTFVLHGDRDPVEKEQAQFLVNTISDSQLHRFPEGGHNIHQQYPTEFNKLVQNFLEEY